MCELHSESEPLYLAILNIIWNDVSKETEIYLFYFSTFCLNGGSGSILRRIHISISHGFEELSFIRTSYSFIDRTFFLHIWDHNIHYFLDTCTHDSLLSRSLLFSSLKFKMAGID